MVKKVKLGSICDIFSAGDKPKIFSDFETDELKVPVYGNGRDNEGLVGYTDKAGVSSEAVTVSARGSSCGVAFYRTQPYMPIVRLISLIAKPGIDTKYLYYQVCNRHFAGAGSGQPQITIPDIADAPIHLETELEIQEIISEVLFTLDMKISNNNAIRSDLEGMAKLLYDYWFVQFDFPDENGKPYKSSGGKMVWNEDLKREIPAGWEVKPLSELCSFSNGINYDKSEIGNKTYRIVNVRNITASSLLLDDSDFDEITLKSSQAERYIIDDNDILVARSGTPGATRLLMNNDGNIIFCGFIIRCAPYDVGLRYYLTYVLKRLEGTNATKTGGSILQNVSQDTLGRVLVVIPPEYVTSKFSEIITGYHSMIQNAIEENQQLSSLRDFLLPMLMNGQVKIKNSRYREEIRSSVFAVPPELSCQS